MNPADTTLARSGAKILVDALRIHGVDKIKPAPLESHAAVNGRILTTLQIRTRAAKRALASRGMLERARAEDRRRILHLRRHQVERAFDEDEYQRE